MKLRLHHIEICVKDPAPVIKLFRDQLGLNLLGYRESHLCVQYVLKLARTAFIVTSRKGKFYLEQNNNCESCISVRKGREVPELGLDSNEDWTLFCCDEDKGSSHIDSVFNVAVEVKDLSQTLDHISLSGATIIRGMKCIETSEGQVQYAVIKSCCGNVVHTLIQKEGYRGWFLPGFRQLPNYKDLNPLTQSHLKGITMSHFDHFTLACRVGETSGVIEWYERMFRMKRFMTNRQETEEEGLVIGDDVGMRLKVLEFWKCSETGIASQSFNDWEPLKIVIAESLPNTKNTQIESFLSEHEGPGIQHVGLHTEDMLQTVDKLTNNGVKFRHPPPTYYTEIGQLNVIKSSGEDVDTLRHLGILLDNEADIFDEEHESKDRYLMQVFTHPIFDRDTFFLEVLERHGAKGFGVGNVTALARSVNAYQAMLKNGTV